MSKCKHCGRRPAPNCDGSGMTARYSRARHEYANSDDPHVYDKCPNIKNAEPIYDGPSWNRQIVGYRRRAPASAGGRQ